MAALCLALGSGPAWGHVFIIEPHRVGAFPSHPGQGWVAEAYLNLPDERDNLIKAENYIAQKGIDPDFTFRTDWIDFPSGPDTFRLDNEFETIGDFLDDYIYDVSDPDKLDEPFGNLLIRFRGFIKVSVRWDTEAQQGAIGWIGLPVWMEFGSLGHDGYRTRMVDTIYRNPVTDANSGAMLHENAIIMGVGLFPFEVTYFNRYDFLGLENHRFAGIELYSWHPGGLKLPGGDLLVHPLFGPATIVPPNVIYQEEDIRPLIAGDFEADSDIDVSDFQWFQHCFTGDEGEDGGVLLDLGCANLDFDGDGDVDLDDYTGFQGGFNGP